MGLFRKRKSRATRRAEARALKARAKLDAKLAAKNEAKRIRSAERSESKAIRAQVKTQTDRTAVKVAQTELRTAREGKLLLPGPGAPDAGGVTAARPRPRPGDLPGRDVGPRGARRTARRPPRGSVDRHRPVLRLGRPAVGPDSRRRSFAAPDRGGQPKDAETKQFVGAMTERLTALGRGHRGPRRCPTPAGGPRIPPSASSWTALRPT